MCVANVELLRTCDLLVNWLGPFSPGRQHETARSFFRIAQTVGFGKAETLIGHRRLLFRVVGRQLEIQGTLVADALRLVHFVFCEGFGRLNGENIEAVFDVVDLL